MPAQKTFRSIRVRGVARFEGPVVGASPGGSATKELTAVISLNGAAAPTFDAIVRNTLGGVPEWASGGEGIYYLQLAGAFPAGKVFAPSFLAGYGSGQVYVTAARLDDDTLELRATDRNGQSVSVLHESLTFEVRVYE